VLGRPAKRIGTDLEGISAPSLRPLAYRSRKNQENRQRNKKRKCAQSRNIRYTSGVAIAALAARRVCKPVGITMWLSTAHGRIDGHFFR
jgi:hypothetical protein